MMKDLLVATASALALVSSASAYTTTKSFAPQGAALAAAADPLSGSGKYYIKNVQTGNILSFWRANGVTNLSPLASGTSVDIQVNTTTAKGSQLRIGNGVKCGSAQWNVYNDNKTASHDWAMVSYACKVGAGNLTGTATLEPTKQWWYAVSADTSIVPIVANPAPPKTTTTAKTSTTTVKSSTAKTTTTTVKTTTKAATTTTVAPPKATALAATSCTVTSDCKGTIPANSHQRCYKSKCTFGCNSGFVTNSAGTACVRSTKRSYTPRGPELEARFARPDNRRPVILFDSELPEEEAGEEDESAQLEARQSTTSKPFYIIAQDHINDMPAMALGPNPLATYGGYQSTELRYWNKTDAAQLWVFVKIA